MIQQCEDFLHDTRKWTVQNSNGDIEPFDGNKLFQNICEITQIAITHSKQLNKDINPETISRIATIQVCAELQSVYTKNEYPLVEIPSAVIKSITERKLSEISFPIAKAYIIESAIKMLHKLH